MADPAFSGGPIVLDTNVLISRVLSPNNVAAKTVDWAISERDIVLSVPLLAELSEVLARPKFSKFIDAAGRRAFLQALLTVAPVVDLSVEVKVCRDPKDDHLLSLALSTRSPLIVTGDHDLLALHLFKAVSILSPRETLAALKAPQV